MDTCARPIPALLRGLSAIFAAGVILTAFGTPAAAWHEFGGWRSYYFNPYNPYGWRPPVKRTRRPPVERPTRATRARPAEPKRPSLSETADGELLIVVSLNTQRLKLYSDGVAVAQSPVSTGTASHPTPTGLFNIIQKNRFHRSNLYSNAPMPYMQRLTWSGVALHEGHLPGYPASHGCIRLPRAFAHELWRTTRLGTRVIVAQDEITPVEIGHARLAQLAPRPSEVAESESGTADELIKVASASVADASGEAAPPATPDLGLGDSAGVSAGKDLPFKPGPISVFVSRKEGKLYVRKGFEPIYSTTVTILDKDKPLGTHLFTALASKDDGATLRWTVVSLVDRGPAPASIMEREPGSRRSRRASATETQVKPSVVRAAAALDRIEMPPDAIDFISGLMTPGAALIISDQGLGHETGRGTDFIVLTP